MVTEFIPFGSRINEYFEGCIKKKPLKSYDFKGFNSICFSAGGERGICLLQKLPIKSILRKALNLSDTSTDTSFIRLLLF